jgi:hypothetical protein
MEPLQSVPSFMGSRHRVGAILMEVAVKVLLGHPFHQKSDDELRAQIRRAAEAAQDIRGVDAEAEALYISQLNDAMTILGARRHYQRTAA